MCKLPLLDALVLAQYEAISKGSLVIPITASIPLKLVFCHRWSFRSLREIWASTTIRADRWCSFLPAWFASHGTGSTRARMRPSVSTAWSARTLPCGTRWRHSSCSMSVPVTLWNCPPRTCLGLTRSSIRVRPSLSHPACVVRVCVCLFISGCECVGVWGRLCVPVCLCLWV